MTIMASASRAVQRPAALAIPVTGPGSGWAFTDRTHAKQRHAPPAIRRGHTNYLMRLRFGYLPRSAALTMASVSYAKSWSTIHSR